MAGTAGKVTLPISANALRKVPGNGSPRAIIGIPFSSMGNTRLENPYECAIEITPKFGAVLCKPIVSQICSQSATN
jgi:hypothetical protein